MGCSRVNWNVQQIYEGCLIASLAHAMMVAKYPELSFEHSWDGFNHNVQDGEGGRGTITFADGVCVGAFRMDSFVHECLDYVSALSMASPFVQQIAKQETLQYLLENINGNVEPVVTTMFWSDESGQLISPHIHDKMIERGGKLLERQALETSRAFKAWCDYYDMTTEQVQLMEYLFHKKLEQPDETIIMTGHQIALLGDDEEGLEESRTSFAELNIKWH